MNIIKGRYPDEEAAAIADGGYTLRLKLNSVYDAYIFSDDEYWLVRFTKNGAYVAMGLCSNTIGKCVDGLLYNSDLIDLLDSGNFL